MDDIPLGRDLTRGDILTVSQSVLFQHLYGIGKSGTGKSSMMEGMMLADILAGRSFALFDPHGTTFTRIADALGTINPETGQDRVNDVVLFDPLSTNSTVYNPCAEDGQLARVVDTIIASFQHVHPDSWGNRMEKCFRGALFLAVENKLSLSDVPRILIDADFRASLRVPNEAIQLWLDEYNGFDERFQEQVREPVTNKLQSFSADPLIRRAVDGRSTLDIPAIIGNPVLRPDGSYRRRKPKILLLNLSKGSIGEDNSHALGTLILSRIVQAVHERQTVPKELWTPYRIYLDEFQSFVNPAVANTLDEVRKYLLSVVMMHQRRKQIRDENVRDAVLSSVSTLVTFRVGAADAKDLAAELDLFDSYGQPRPRLLTALPNYQAYVRTIEDGKPTHPVLIETIPQSLPTGSLNRVQKRIARRYTTPARSNEHGEAQCESTSSMGPRQRGSSKRRRSTWSR